MPSNLVACEQPPSGWVQYCQVKTASSAVTGVPSDHFRSGRSFQVIEVMSAEMPPLSSVGISVMSFGTITPFGSRPASGSSTIEEA